MLTKRGKKCFSLMLCGVLILSMPGCGKKEKESSAKSENQTGVISGTLSADDDAKEVINTANAVYGEKSRRGTNFTYIYTYGDGSTEEVTGFSSFDADKSIVQFQYSSKEDGDVTTFSTKENNRFYTYETSGDSWIRYEEKAGEGEETVYEYQEDGKVADFSEEAGYTDVSYSNEGVENVDGSDCVKIQVQASMAYEDDLELPESTRESVLSDFDISEEAIEATGLSDALDAYVEALNSESTLLPTVINTTIWIDCESHLPVKSDLVEDTSETVDDGSYNDKLDAFEDQLWMAESYDQDVEDGLSKEEALAHIEKDRPNMEKQIAQEKEEYAQSEDAYEEAEEDYSVGTVVNTENISLFVYDDACPEIGELPTDYEAISQADYLNGDY